LGGGSQALAKVAGLEFDAAEEFAVGRIDEGLGELLQERRCLRLEPGQDPLATVLTVFWEGKRR
jgi:hypothetical protein